MRKIQSPNIMFNNSLSLLSKTDTVSIKRPCPLDQDVCGCLKACLKGNRCLYSALTQLTSIVRNLLKDVWLSDPVVNPTVTFPRKLFTVSGIQNRDFHEN